MHVGERKSMNQVNILEKIAKYNKFGSKLGLERMEKLLEILGNPEKDLKVIHVGGTNGKGSTCRFIYSCLMENGYKVGLFTSPFLESFTERIEISGEQIPIYELEEIGQEVIEKVEEYMEETKDPVTEFEIVTVIALMYFKIKEVDFVVLEVGLGGSKDSTNIIKTPLITAITSISYDHMDRLGETLEEIGREKAGIIKGKVPVMSNVEEIKGQREIAKKAYGMSAPFYDLTKIKYHILEMNKKRTIFSANILETNYNEIEISLIGEHQVKNAITALACVEYLRKNGIIKVTKENLYNGFKKARNKGRLEIFEGNPTMVLDGAHNLAAFQNLKKTWDDIFPNKNPLVIMGILEDKATEEVVEAIEKLGDEFLLVGFNNRSAMDPAALKIKLEKFKGKKIHVISTPMEIKDYIGNKEYEIILFTGSLYFIGEILKDVIFEEVDLRRL